jgi:hypothetical protein
LGDPVRHRRNSPVLCGTITAIATGNSPSVSLAQHAGPSFLKRPVVDRKAMKPADRTFVRV